MLKPSLSKKNYFNIKKIYGKNNYDARAHCFLHSKPLDKLLRDRPKKFSLFTRYECQVGRENYKPLTNA